MKGCIRIPERVRSKVVYLMSRPRWTVLDVINWDFLVGWIHGNPSTSALSRLLIMLWALSRVILISRPCPPRQGGPSFSPSIQKVYLPYRSL